jgi:two-component system, LytTR family, sensor kinase
MPDVAVAAIPSNLTGVRSWRRLWALAFGVATVLGLWTTLFVYVGMRSMHKPLSLRTAALAGLPDWYFWATLFPLVFWLGLRFRFDRGQWTRAVLIHLVAGAGVVMLELLLFTTFNHRFYYNPWAPAPPAFRDAYVQNVLRFFHFAFLIYSVIVAAAHAFSLAQQKHRQQLEAARLSQSNAELEVQLAQARMDVLRAQLHPHFVFNALNTVSGLIRDRRGNEATELIARLGALLRRCLATSGGNETSLRDELEFVDGYLVVERARFRDRLAVQYEIEPEVLGDQVPTMILQPLVENAIRHGLRDSTAGRLWIRAHGEDRHLCLEVCDNGRGLSGTRDTNGGAGVGLANTRARLERMYGSDYRFELGGHEGSGVRVSIRIPRSSVVEHVALLGAG